MLGVGAEVLALFLALGSGRRQVFNEYFHSFARGLAGQRCSRWRGARLEHRGRWGEESVREAREELRGGWE